MQLKSAKASFGRFACGWCWFRSPPSRGKLAAGHPGGGCPDEGEALVQIPNPAFLLLRYSDILFNNMYYSLKDSTEFSARFRCITRGLTNRPVAIRQGSLLLNQQSSGPAVEKSTESQNAVNQSISKQRNQPNPKL
jgi:hypothetical protein